MTSAVALLAACAGTGAPHDASNVREPSESVARPAASCAAPSRSLPPGIQPVAPAGLTVPHGFEIRTIARVGGARELAALPNGDLLVGTNDSAVYIVAHAESAGAAADPRTFAELSDSPAAGVTFAPDRCEIFFGTQYGVYATRYAGGDLNAKRIVKLAALRTCPEGGCGSDHRTTSVAYSNGTLYASVGSDCDACAESDPTRAAILQMRPDGSDLIKRAKRVRNAIALAIDPSGALWAGGAGQDALPFGHPYEYLDNVSSHPGVADYGWPVCEENHQSYGSGADCSHAVVPLVELPAYSTIVGAAFYPRDRTGPYAFPAAYRGSLFATTHGSWHTADGGAFAAPPRVVSIAMNGDRPRKPVDWNDPRVQWETFVNGFQTGSRTRIGRPTGVAVGPKGSLFVADDDNGVIYRIRYVP